MKGYLPKADVTLWADESDPYYYTAEGADNMEMKKYDIPETVECHMKNGVILQVPKDVFNEVVMRTQLPDREYVSYKEGAAMFGMGERKFFDLVRDAKAKIQYGGKVLVSVKDIRKFLDYCKVY